MNVAISKEQYLTSERKVYELINSKHHSPKIRNMGMKCIDDFIALAKPFGTVLDLGAGNGIASKALKERGFVVTAIDFAGNALCHNLDGVASVVHDLVFPIPCKADWGFATDVMEHIHPACVDDVLANIGTACVKGAFFQICFVKDVTGPKTVGRNLHLTIQDEDWWERKLGEFWPHVRVLGANSKGQGKFFCYWK